MSYWIDVEIEELELKIPKKDFPLKSDVIVGYKMPAFVNMVDECDEELVYLHDNGESFEIQISEDENEGRFGKYNDDTPIEELKELCIKYGGTLIAKEVGEDGEVSYTRVREGKAKKVKIEEEDE